MCELSCSNKENVPVGRLPLSFSNSLTPSYTSPQYCRYYKGTLLACVSSSEIIVPLLTLLDNLLVVGGMQEQEDINKLLTLLEPQTFAPRGSKCREYFLWLPLCPLVFFCIPSCFRCFLCPLVFPVSPHVSGVPSRFRCPLTFPVFPIEH